MTIIDGKKISEDILNEISLEVEQRTNKGYKTPHLAAILVGDDGPSQTYVNSKINACKEAETKLKLCQEIWGSRVWYEAVFIIPPQMGGSGGEFPPKCWRSQTLPPKFYSVEVYFFDIWGKSGRFWSKIPPKFRGQNKHCS